MRAKEFRTVMQPDDRAILEMAVLMQGLALHNVTLKEANLTTDQIQSLFGDLEQKMVKATTTAGKVLGTAGKGLIMGAKGLRTINDYKDRLIAAAQNTKPVQGFDAAADKAMAQIKAAIGKKFPQAVAGLEKYAEWAKKNPMKQALIIAALTALVSVIAAPAATGLTAAGYTFLGGSATGAAVSASAGAVAGFILRTLNSLLKGEKLSGALLKGASSGLMAYIAGMGIKELAHMFGDPIIKDFVITTDAGKKEVWLSSFREMVDIKIDDPETGKSLVKHMYLDVIGSPADIDRLKDTWDKIHDAMEAGDIDQADSLLKGVADQNWNVHKDIGWDQSVLQHASEDERSKLLSWSGSFVGKDLADVNDFNRAIEQSQGMFMEKVRAIAKGLEAVSQGGAAAGPVAKEKNTPAPTPTAESRQLSEVDIKGAVGKIGSWAAKQSKEVMQQFTTAKLTKAWKDKGSPTDSDQIHALMVEMGIPADVVNSAFGTQKIPPPAPRKPASMVKAAKKDQPSISTANPQLDDKVNEIMRTQGRDAAVKYLKDLKVQIAKAKSNNQKSHADKTVKTAASAEPPTATPEPITVNGEKIMPTDPRYKTLAASVAKQVTAPKSGQKTA
jgi:hypothetical protein